VFDKKEYDKEYNSRPEIKERKKEYCSTPGYKKYKKEYDKEYSSRPEVKERKKEYRSTSEYKKYKKEYDKEYNSRPEVKERKKEYSKEYNSSFVGHLSRARARSKIKNIEFNLTIEYLKSIYPKNNMCPLLNIPLDWQSSHNHPSTPSLDRVDSSKGYIKGNVQWVSWRANVLKNNATPEELLRLAQNYKKIYDKVILS